MPKSAKIGKRASIQEIKDTSLQKNFLKNFYRVVKSGKVLKF